jgi:ferrous iron transport protein B
MLAAKKLEFSYAGRIGKVIEPAIEPLGFDWKIGIALLTSFAAREVFVGTMATIYSLGSEDDHLKVRERMALEVNPATGRPIYNLATSMSLLIFYVFAMQCMSTLAVVKRETGSWKWPIFQFIFMGVVAYVGSLITYQLLG